MIYDNTDDFSFVLSTHDRRRLKRQFKRLSSQHDSDRNAGFIETEMIGARTSSLNQELNDVKEDLANNTWIRTGSSKHKKVPQKAKKIFVSRDTYVYNQRCKRVDDYCRSHDHVSLYCPVYSHRFGATPVRQLNPYWKADQRAVVEQLFDQIKHNRTHGTVWFDDEGEMDFSVPLNLSAEPPSIEVILASKLSNFGIIQPIDSFPEFEVALLNVELSKTDQFLTDPKDLLSKTGGDNAYGNRHTHRRQPVFGQSDLAFDDLMDYGTEFVWLANDFMHVEMFPTGKGTIVIYVSIQYYLYRRAFFITMPSIRWTWSEMTNFFQSVYDRDTLTLRAFHKVCKKILQKGGDEVTTDEFSKQMRDLENSAESSRKQEIDMRMRIILPSESSSSSSSMSTSSVSSIEVLPTSFFIPSPEETNPGLYGGSHPCHIAKAFSCPKCATIFDVTFAMFENSVLYFYCQTCHDTFQPIIDSDWRKNRRMAAVVNDVKSYISLSCDLPVEDSDGLDDVTPIEATAASSWSCSQLLQGSMASSSSSSSTSQASVVSSGGEVKGVSISQKHTRSSGFKVTIGVQSEEVNEKVYSGVLVNQVTFPEYLSYNLKSIVRALGGHIVNGRIAAAAMARKINWHRNWFSAIEVDDDEIDTYVASLGRCDSNHRVVGTDTIKPRDNDVQVVAVKLNDSFYDNYDRKTNVVSGFMTGFAISSWLAFRRIPLLSSFCAIISGVGLLMACGYAFMRHYCRPHNRLLTYVPSIVTSVAETSPIDANVSSLKTAIVHKMTQGGELLIDSVHRERLAVDTALVTLEYLRDRNFLFSHL
jgi:hypothetical protein